MLNQKLFLSCQFSVNGFKKSPHIAVMLMITSEHLDWHGSVEEYIDAKRNLVRGQSEKDFAILNRDYPATNESDIHTSGKIFTTSRERTRRRKDVLLEMEKFG